MGETGNENEDFNEILTKYRHLYDGSVHCPSSDFPVL